MGTESRGVGQSQCEPCRMGAFRDDSMEACADCEMAVAVNTVTLERGSQSRARCVCKPGYFAQWNVSDGTPPGMRPGELCAPCASTALNCSRAGACTHRSARGPIQTPRCALLDSIGCVTLALVGGGARSHAAGPPADAWILAGSADVGGANRLSVGRGVHRRRPHRWILHQ